MSSSHQYNDSYHALIFMRVGERSSWGLLVKYSVPPQTRTTLPCPVPVGHKMTAGLRVRLLVDTALPGQIAWGLAIAGYTGYIGHSPSASNQARSVPLILWQWEERFPIVLGYLKIPSALSVRSQCAFG